MSERMPAGLSNHVHGLPDSIGVAADDFESVGFPELDRSVQKGVRMQIEDLAAAFAGLALERAKQLRGEA